MSAHRKKPGAPEDTTAPEAAEPAGAGAPAPEAASDAAAPPAETVDYWREHCLRAMAEVQNLKRRAGQDVEERTLLRLEGLLADLLRVDDYFSAALDHVPAAVRAADGAGAFLAGIGAIRQALESVLLSHGAVFLAPAPGAAFDPAEHEAVEVREEAGLEAERMELLARGCRFGRRILRPARVRLLKPAAPA